LGGLGKIWEACAPWPQHRTATEHEKLIRDMYGGYPAVTEDRILSDFDMILIPEYNGQTDGRNQSIIANTALCTASYADAL